MLSLLAKMKVLLKLEKNSWKIEIKIFPVLRCFTWKLELVSDILWVIVDKCNASCNAVDDLYTNKCASSRTKDINVKVFSLTTRINQAQTLVKHISCDCQCKFNSATCNSNKK